MCALPVKFPYCFAALLVFSDGDRELRVSVR